MVLFETLEPLQCLYKNQSTCFLMHVETISFKNHTQFSGFMFKAYLTLPRTIFMQQL